MRTKIRITPDMVCQILEMMGDGATPTQVAARLRISKLQLNNLLNDPDNIEFREGFDLGLTLFEAKAEETYAKMMKGEIPVRDSMMIRWMERHFNWKNKTDLTVTDQSVKGMTDEELNEKIKQLSTINGQPESSTD